MNLKDLAKKSRKLFSSQSVANSRYKTKGTKFVAMTFTYQINSIA